MQQFNEDMYQYIIACDKCELSDVSQSDDMKQETVTETVPNDDVEPTSAEVPPKKQRKRTAK